MIQSDDLVYFKEIALNKNLRRASERLGMSQPALSFAIQRLEKKLNCQLFIRGKTGVRLTKAGNKLLLLTGELEENWKKIYSLVSEEVNAVEGTYSLGCHTSVGVYTLHYFVGALLSRYPKLSFRFKHGLSREMTHAVISNQLDFGIVVNPTKHSGLVITKLYEDRVKFWKSPKLQNKDLLIYDPSLLQSNELIQLAAKKGFSFSREIHTSSLNLIAKLTSAGAGVGILPETVLKELEKKECIPLAPNSPELVDKICLIYKKENQNTYAFKKIADSIIESSYP